MSRDDEHDDLLWEISRLGDPPGAAAGPLDDDTLRAWRESRLDPAEAAAVEAALAGDPRARARLASLAGLEPAAPPPALRRRVLERFGPPGSAAVGRRWKPALGLAASLVLVVGTVFLLRERAPSPLPAGLDFEVVASGLAERRGEPASVSGAAVEAYPETRVRIAVDPRAGAVADLDFGLYRARGGRLERLTPPGPVAAGVERRVERGAATFSARAADLVGAAPGRRTLYVVVARRGDLPRSLEDPGDDPAARLAAGGRRRVYPLPITLLPPPGAEELRP